MISPPAPPPPKPASRRWSWARLSANPDVRSVQIGVLVTIILHLLLIGEGHRLLGWIGGEDMGRSNSMAFKSFDIRLTPLPPAAPPPKPQPMKFVEANPNAPDNVPDKTNNFAARNQQAAQEKPTPKNDTHTPASKGRDDSTALVSGRLEKPAPTSPPVPKVAPKSMPSAPARREQTPPAGHEKDKGEDADGFASNVSKSKPSDKIAPEPVDGSPNATSDNGQPHSLYYSASIDPNHPQPRRTLPTSAIHARPTPLMNNNVGTANIGVAAHDAKWSSYGAYLQKLSEIVQVQWDRILDQSDFYPTEGTLVTVVFKINSAGKIDGIEKVSCTPNSQTAADTCVSAITMPSPYDAWTADMIAALGNSQELTFTFLYQ